MDPSRPTPAVELNDGADFAPIELKFLLSRHFSAIAAAGPVVAPILAGVAFGWVPALLWTLVGCTLVGGALDLTSFTASIRHLARSIAQVVRDHMTRRSYSLFLSFVWIALASIIVASTGLTATAVIGQQELEDGGSVTGGGASSSLMYLVPPVVTGLPLRFTKLSLNPK
jgi:carbon starvation protein